jgi:hypothetical protein
MMDLGHRVKKPSHCDTLWHADDYDSAVCVLEIAVLFEDVVPA